VRSRWVLAASLAILLAGRASTQDAAPASADRLLDRTREAIRLGTTKDGHARVKLLLDLAQERLADLEASGASGPLRDALAASYEKTVAAALGVIENGAAQGRNVQASIDRYVEATGKHGPALERILARAPEAARPGLSRALEASRHGQERALAANERGKRRASEEKKKPKPTPSPRGPAPAHGPGTTNRPAPSPPPPGGRPAPGSADDKHDVPEGERPHKEPGAEGHGNGDRPPKGHGR
jgi:hypothetical protein